MTIAIVDDELETRQYMQGLVAQYLAETGRMAQLVFYPDGASFLVGCEHPDIVLMDIDMPGMDGLSTAEQLRRSHPDAILIFTTRLSQCAIRGYEVDAIGFLVKPVTLPGLTVKLNKAFKRVEYRQSKICLKTKDSILFLEKKRDLLCRGQQSPCHLSYGAGRIPRPLLPAGGGGTVGRGIQPKLTFLYRQSGLRDDGRKERCDGSRRGDSAVARDAQGLSECGQPLLRREVTKMLTNLANYLNNDFPFHMFFAVQILLAEGLFVVRMKSRLRPLKIVLPVVLCYLVLAWFHPLLGHRFARVAAIFAESLLVLCLTMDIPTTNALCIGISSYAIQNLAFKVGGLATCWMAKPRDPLFYLLSGASFVVVYAVCYLMFVRRFPENGDLKLGNWKVLFLTLVTLLTVFVRSVSLPTDISLLDRLFSILSVIMVLVLIYQCMYADEMRREKEIIESLLAREESRHQLLGKTIDSINMKCHDLRYHIDTYRRAQQLDEHAAFFDEVEQEIQRYEYTFHTGNAALDSVLSEKSLYCSANHILLTTMLDVSLLAPIEKSDIYSIFGNALDNAIQAVMAEAPENRSVNIRVSDVVGMTQIVFENFCSKPPEMHEGLPKTEKDTQYHGFGLRSIRYIIEKYDGHMSIDTKDQMFTLSLLLPRPQQSA